MKKGRHRRYIEARALKHQSDGLDDLFQEDETPCEECQALPGQDHKPWCLNHRAKPAAAEVDDSDWYDD